MHVDSSVPGREELSSQRSLEHESAASGHPGAPLVPDDGAEEDLVKLELLEAHRHDSLDGFRRESFPLGSAVEEVRELCAAHLPVQVLHMHLPYQLAFRALPDPVPEPPGCGPIGQSGLDVFGALTTTGELFDRSRKVVPQSIAVVFPQ